MNNLNTADDVMAVLFNRHGSPTLEAAVSADTAHAANARWLRNKIQRGELQGEALETARRTIRHLDARAREARDVDYDAVKRVIHRLDREGYTTPKKATTRAIDLYLQEAAGGVWQ